MTRIQKIESNLYLWKDADTIIRNDHFCGCCCLPNNHIYTCPTRMISRIVEHFCKSILPNVPHIFWLFPESLTHIFCPHYVLFQSGRYQIEVTPFNEWCEKVGPTSCLSAVIERTLKNKT